MGICICIQVAPLGNFSCDDCRFLGYSAESYQTRAGTVIIVMDESKELVKAM